MTSQEHEPILRKKAAGYSWSIRLQLISVIQSMALGLFVFRLAPEKLVDWNYLLQCLLILQFIVATWHEYVLGTVIYDWPLGYLDAWIPIAFGIAQFYIISNAPGKSSIPDGFTTGDFTSFAWSLSLFALVALVAFLNQHFKSQAYEPNKEVIKVLLWQRRLNIFLTAVFLCIFSIFAIMAPVLTEVRWQRSMLIILNLCLMGHQLAGTVATRKLFYKSLPQVQ